MKTISRCLMLLLCAVLLLGLAASVVARADFGDFSTGGDSYDSDSDSGGGGLASLLLCIVLAPFALLAEQKKKARQEEATAQRRRLERPMSEFSAIDPDYNEADLCDWIRDLYVRMQREWGAGNIDSLRGEFTPACFDRFDGQLQRKNAAGQQGHVENIRFISIRPLGWHGSSFFQHLSVQLTVDIVSWNTNRYGKVVSGDPNRDKRMVYEWSLARDTASSDPAQALTVKCPACGEAVRPTLCRCPACRATLGRGNAGWQLSDIIA